MRKSLINRLEETAFSLYDASSNKRCHHFSFIVYKNRIIAIGQNNKKTHPINLINRKKSLKTGIDFSEEKHTCSEFSAVLKLKNRTNINSKKCKLINLRINREKQISGAEPCESCRNLLKFFEFKDVIHTNNSGNYINYNYNK